MICTGMCAEWVQDWDGENYYNSSPRIDPPGPATGDTRVVRGGDFRFDAQDLRSAARGYVSAGLSRASSLARAL